MNLLTHIDTQGIATLTLNRPEVHNAFDDVLIAELSQTLKQLEQDPQVRVVILAGAGQHFCAGADLSWMQRMINYSLAENRKDALALAELLHQLNQCSKPTIAQIQGNTLGGGIGLIACCDIAIATTTSQFCFSEVKLGLIPAVISPYVIAAIGARAARRYFLTAELFSATTAQRLGLIHELVEPTALSAAATALAAQLLNNSPIALGAAKQLIQEVAGQAINDKLIMMTAERIAALRVSPSGQEGIKAFLAKRKPVWPAS